MYYDNEKNLDIIIKYIIIKQNVKKNELNRIKILQLNIYWNIVGGD
jgi:hypothetical protein